MHDDHQEDISSDLEYLLSGGAAAALVEEFYRPALGVLNETIAAHHAVLQTLMTHSPDGDGLAGCLYRLALDACRRGRNELKREPGRASAVPPSQPACWRRLVGRGDERAPLLSRSTPGEKSTAWFTSYQDM